MGVKVLSEQEANSFFFFLFFFFAWAASIQVSLKRYPLFQKVISDPPRPS